MSILQTILELLGQVTSFVQLFEVVLDLLRAIGLLPGA